MKILAIESSALSASVCIEAEGKLIAESFQNNGLTHSRTVMPMIRSMLDACGERLEDMDKVAVAAGPGSFTGLRIGASVAKGLSWAVGIPVCGVSTLEALAWQASWADGLVCPVMDARAGQVYNALFRVCCGEITRVSEDRAVPLAQLINELRSEKNIIVLGDGAQICYNGLTEEGIQARMLPDGQRFPRASGVARAARRIPGGPPEELQVQYLRLPQAERERLERLRKSGQVNHTG